MTPKFLSIARRFHHLIFIKLLTGSVDLQHFLGNDLERLTMQTIFFHVREFLKNIQLKQLIAVCFVSIMLLSMPTTQLADAKVDSRAYNTLDEVQSRGEEGRPRTTGQWQSEKESLSGQPGKVVERMGKEAADAAGSLADTYGQTVKDVTPGLESKKLPSDQ